MNIKSIALALVVVALMGASSQFTPSRAEREDCVPGKTCPPGKAYEKRTLVRLGCQALEDLEDSISPAERRQEDPVKSWEGLSEIDRLNVSRIHAVERLKGCSH